jgi:uncharacterized peroxidase-related enzyme
MSRIPQVQPESATGEAKQLLEAVKTKMGRVPNMMKTLANAPAALNAYLQFSGALAGGVLPGKTREQIALAVGQANSCDYCLAAHSTIGKMVGLTHEQILDGRHGKATDAKTHAILLFARKLVDDRGQVADAELQKLRQAGVNEAEITEIVANVALNIFTNYFNHVSSPEIDFPKAEALSA